MEGFKPSNDEVARQYLHQYSEDSVPEIIGINNDINFPIKERGVYPNPHQWFQTDERIFEGHYLENGITVDFCCSNPIKSKQFLKALNNPFANREYKKDLKDHSLFYLIDTLTIGDQNENKKIDLLSELPPEYFIFFIDTERPGSSARINSDDKYIETAGDLTKISTQLALLHEIGHSLSLVDKKIMMKHYYRQGLDINEMAAAYKEERDAWAYALRKVKPILKYNNEATKQTLEMVHSCLSTHYQSLIKHEVPRQDFVAKLFSDIKSIFIQD
ncbi:MAG: hypothetical protein WCO23_01590 [bacterium]